MSGTEVIMEEEKICQCGINYQTWLDYDIQCVDDGLHIWEE